MMSTALLAPVALQPVFAMLTADRTEVSYRVVIGLALVALAWIAAGLWLIHVGEKNHRSIR
jgi:hypothetical protein